MKNDSLGFPTSHKIVLRVTIGVLFGTLAYNVSNATIDAVETYQEKQAQRARFGKYVDDFMKTEDGRQINCYDTSRAISVILDEMDEDAKKQITEAVYSIPKFCKNVKYTIWDAKDYDKESDLKYIEISLVDDIAGSAIGKTYINFDKNTAEVEFPIKIEIEKKYKDAVFNTENADSVLKAITAHELGHTLLLTDKYDKDDKDKTIMYYQIDQDSQPIFTSEDEEKIKYVWDYDSQLSVSVERPKQMNFVYSKKKEEKTL